MGKLNLKERDLFLKNKMMMTINPRFSIVIMTYNRLDLLKGCLKSAINQDYNGKYEIIVVDDASTDGTKEYLSKIKIIKYIRHDINKGVAAARNTGIRASSGKYIAFIADDYVLPKDYLSNAMKFFNDYKEARIMTSKFVPLSNNYVSRVQYYNYEIILKELLLFGQPIKYIFKRLPKHAKIINSLYLLPTRAAIFKASLVKEIMFNDELRINEDVLMSFELRKKKIPVYLNENILVKNNYDNSFMAALKKEYTYGRYSFIYGKIDLWKAVRQLLGGVVDSLVALRQTRSIKELLLMPGMFLVVMAPKVGFFIRYLNTSSRI